MPHLRNLVFAAIFVARQLHSVWGQSPSLADIPKCAQPAILSSLQNSGCQPTDTNCLCNSQTYINGLTTSIQQACNSADQAKVLALAKQLCPSVTAHLLASATASPAANGAAETTSPQATSASENGSGTKSGSGNQASTPSHADASSTTPPKSGSNSPHNVTYATPSGTGGGILTAPPTYMGKPTPTIDTSSLFGSNHSSAAKRNPRNPSSGKVQAILMALGMIMMGLVFTYL